MSKITDTTIRIQKLKDFENWISWYFDIENILIKDKTWKYVCDRVKKSTELTSSTKSKRSDVNVSQQVVYVEKMKKYEKDLKKYVENHEKIMIEIRLICEIKSRVHLVNVKNAHKTLKTLRKLYEVNDLTVIEIFWRESTRTNLSNHINIEAYDQHIKSHKEKIIQTKKNLQDWEITIIFRADLLIHLNSYVFDLLMTTENENRKLTIEQMIRVLNTKKKRINYDEKNKIVRSTKFNNRDEDKFEIFRST